MFGYFSKRQERKHIAQKLYEQTRLQARSSEFYSQHGVPDTVDGRFELVLLHGYLVWERLAQEGKAGKLLAQAFFDVMFKDIVQALRQMGVGDLAVPHHMKRMMKAFKGRALNYKNAAHDDLAMAETLKRNLFGTLSGSLSGNEVGDEVSDETLSFFIAYIKEIRAYLATQSADAVLAGNIEFIEKGESDVKIGMVA